MSEQVIRGEVVDMPSNSVMGSEMIDPFQRQGEYEQFLSRKRFTPVVSGLTEIPPINPAMFPFQADILRWCLQLGRSAAFMGTGTGKSFLELEWARIVSQEADGPVIIPAPKHVANQLAGYDDSMRVISEAKKFGINAVYQTGGEPQAPIVVTNYERLDSFDLSEYVGVALDESSILKALDGKTRTKLIEVFADTPYKLASTATPAPNDYTELGNHAEFLGVMTMTEMLSMFFVHDGGETQKWRLKGHARKAFWEWVCKWSVNVRRPSDLGYDDGDFVLPELIYHEHIINVDTPSEGMLFAMPAESLPERIAARRATVDDRVKESARIVLSEPDEKWNVWCNLNDEQDGMAKALGERAVSIDGRTKDAQEAGMLDSWMCGEKSDLISKSKVFGFGLNFQLCSHLVFVGITDSWESFFQTIRRNWRFGQKRKVHCHIVVASTEGDVLENLKRKEREAEQMADEMAEMMLDLTRVNIRGTVREELPYIREVKKTETWEMHLADCVDLASELANDSIHYSVFSLPFRSLYTYSATERDMGNSRTPEEFWNHYKFLIEQTYRVMMPGRLVSVHCMNLPTSKVKNGFIGIEDFRGDIIRYYCGSEAATLHEAKRILERIGRDTAEIDRALTDASLRNGGFIYHSEVCIWKDPVTAMQRTKALGLLHKQIKKDACMSRQGIADYLVTFRKPGDNPERVTNTNDTFPVQLWQNYASPVWMDINPSDTLQYRSAREHADERHIAPLQLEVIRRAIKLWSNPGDLVWSPFAGIGSEGFVALEMGRRFIGSELKKSYFDQACRNLQRALSINSGLFAGIDDDQETADETESVEEMEF